MPQQLNHIDRYGDMTKAPWHLPSLAWHRTCRALYNRRGTWRPPPNWGILVDDLAFQQADLDATGGLQRSLAN